MLGSGDSVGDDGWSGDCAATNAGDAVEPLEAPVPLRRDRARFSRIVDTVFLKLHTARTMKDTPTTSIWDEEAHRVQSTCDYLMPAPPQQRTAAAAVCAYVCVCASERLTGGEDVAGA